MSDATDLSDRRVVVNVDPAAVFGDKLDEEEAAKTSRPRAG